MFQQQYYKPPSQLSSFPKQIFLILNGSPNKIITYSYKHIFNKQQIIRICEKTWQVKFTKIIRFFTTQGVEYQSQDLQMIKNKQRVYVSRGEQFDCEMNFGEYKIIKPLGEGGFGKVVLAENVITKQLAAVKIIKVEKICGATDIDMIFREIQNLKALKHPNIVKIINCYILKNMQVYVVMQYLQGGELLKLLRERKFLTQQQCRHIFYQIVSAICYCHRENIIHRDLKVENILFKNHEQKFIKIADFGISGVADQFNPDFDSGTLKYMAPQVLTAKQKSNTPAVDVWACGVILFYMLCGYLPFNGNSNSQTIHSICDGKYTYPKDNKISQQCKSLIESMLTVNPKKRIKMDEIRDHKWLSVQRMHNKSIDIKQAIEKSKIEIKQQIKGRKQEKDMIIQQQTMRLQEHEMKKIKLQNQKSQIQSIMQKRVKNGRKSMHFQQLNQRKSSLNPIPKRLQKQKQQIMDQLQQYHNKHYQYHNNNPLFQRQKQKRSIIHPPNNNLFRGSGILISGVTKQPCQQMYPKINQKNINYSSQQFPQNVLKNLRRANSRQVYRGIGKDNIMNGNNNNVNIGIGVNGIGVKESNNNSFNVASNKRQEKSRESKDGRGMMKKKSTIINSWK